MSVEKNIATLLKQIELTAQRAGRDPSEISLLAISKGRTVEEMKQAYWAGCRDFGENRVQEALEKIDQMPADVRWHFVGKLQKNKVNKVIGLFSLIHSVDTPDLAEKISRTSLEKGVRTSILLEANTSGESAKSGLTPDQWEEVFPQLMELQGVEILGLMTIAPLTEEEGVIRHCFSELRLLRDRLEKWIELPVLSMGMSNDYLVAIQEGATILRIGTAIFSPHES